MTAINEDCMKFIQFLLVPFIFQVSFGQISHDTLSLIDKVFIRYKSENPGCQLSVSRNGQVIFSKAWGMADLERHIPLSTNSILEAGSVSKQFTAAAILILQQQGKLSLDDNVRKYIPELQDYGVPITLSQMLHHTSGLREWEDIAKLTGWPRGKKFYTNEDVLEIITHQKHLNNKPGNEFLYSNSNYILLAIIIQRVSGLTLKTFTQKCIFEPAGMEHTQWRDDPNRIVSNRAIAYSKPADDFETDMPNEYVYGPGGLLTTTEDLLKWNNFYQSGKLGSPLLLPKQLQPGTLSNGVITNYAAGLYVRKIMGWDNISHDGATASYRAYLETFPALHLSIAILSNTSQFNIHEVADELRKIFVPYKIEETTESYSSIKLSETYLNSLSGMYVNERNRSTFKLSVKGDTLIIDNYLPLIAVTKNIFKATNSLFDIKGTKGLYIPLSPRDSIPFTKVKPVHLSAKDVIAYEGKYFSEETSSSLTVQPDSDKLMIRLNASRMYELIPTYADAFRIDEMDCDVQFIRDSRKTVFTMKVYFWATRGVKFKKINDSH